MKKLLLLTMILFVISLNSCSEKFQDILPRIDTERMINAEDLINLLPNKNNIEEAKMTLTYSKMQDSVIFINYTLYGRKDKKLWIAYFKPDDEFYSFKDTKDRLKHLSLIFEWQDNEIQKTEIEIDYGWGDKRKEKLENEILSTILINDEYLSFCNKRHSSFRELFNINIKTNVKKVMKDQCDDLNYPQNTTYYPPFISTKTYTIIHHDVYDMQLNYKCNAYHTGFPLYLFNDKIMFQNNSNKSLIAIVNIEMGDNSKREIDLKKAIFANLNNNDKVTVKLNSVNKNICHFTAERIQYSGEKEIVLFDFDIETEIITKKQ